MNETSGIATITPKDGFVGTATATVRVTGVERRTPRRSVRFPIDHHRGSAGQPVVDLLAVSDTGVSSTDNITNATELQFQVSGVANGAQVSILADGDVIGQAIATGGTVTITTSNLSALGDGTYAITAIQTVDGQDSSESVAIDADVGPNATRAFTSTPPTAGITQIAD